MEYHETNAFCFPIMLIEYMKFHDILELCQAKAGLSALEDALLAGYDDFKVTYQT